MSYADYLATLPPDDCVFCSEVYRSTAVRSYEHWMVAPNR